MLRPVERLCIHLLHASEARKLAFVAIEVAVVIAVLGDEAVLADEVA
ncbi:MAG: hypothetical protein IPN77_32325 [Sandaracinaceae bacterium]|nr:hypothetical protein [Sandaracinaceae bacterium]